MLGDYSRPDGVRSKRGVASCVLGAREGEWTPMATGCAPDRVARATHDPGPSADCLRRHLDRFAGHHRERRPVADSPLAMRLPW